MEQGWSNLVKDWRGDFASCLFQSLQNSSQRLGLYPKHSASVTLSLAFHCLCIRCLRKQNLGLERALSNSSAIQTLIALAAMVNRAERRSAAVMVMALLAAVLITGEAEAGRLHRQHRHHHSPPAPPGFNEPMTAPSPHFSGSLSGSPADSPFAGGPEAGGPEGSHPRRLSQSARFADSPDALGDGLTGAEGPVSAGPEGFNPQTRLSGSGNLAASPFVDSPFAFGEGPAPGSGC